MRKEIAVATNFGSFTTASDSQHEKSNYHRRFMGSCHRLVHQTARRNIDVPKPYFHSLLTRLIGDKDHEKILDVKTKVAKACRLQVSHWSSNTSIPYRRETEQYSRANTIRCYACGRNGHVGATCPNRESVTKKPSTMQRIPKLGMTDKSTELRS